jgi:hypothetical protein
VNAFTEGFDKQAGTVEDFVLGLHRIGSETIPDYAF